MHIVLLSIWDGRNNIVFLTAHDISVDLNCTLMVWDSGSGFTGLARGHKICRFGVRSSSPPGIDSGFVQDMDGSPAWNVHWRNDQVDVLGGLVSPFLPSPF